MYLSNYVFWFVSFWDDQDQDQSQNQDQDQDQDDDHEDDQDQEWQEAAREAEESDPDFHKMHKLNYRAFDLEGEVLECPWVCGGCLRRSTSCGCPEGFPAWLDSDVGQARQSLLGRYNCRAGPAQCGFCRRGPGHLILLGEWARDVQAIRDGKPLPSSQAALLPDKASGALMGERASNTDRLAPARAARAANALLRRQREAQQQLRRGGGGGGMLDEGPMEDEDGGADGDLYARDYRFRGGGTRKRGRRDLYDDTVVAPAPSRPRGPGRPRLSERRGVPLGGGGGGGGGGNVYGGEMRPSWSSTVEVRLGFTGRRFVRLKLDNCPCPEADTSTSTATQQVLLFALRPLLLPLRVQLF